MLRKVTIPYLNEMETSDDPSTRSATMLGFNLQLTHAAKAGLTGEKADEFLVGSIHFNRKSRSV